MTADLSTPPAALLRALEPDVLGWLGFEHGEPDEPLLPWPRPRHWPTSSQRGRGRHRARGRLRPA